MEKEDLTLELILYISIVLKIIWIILLLLNFFQDQEHFIFIDDAVIKDAENYITVFFSIITAILLIYLYNHLGPKKVVVFGKTKQLLFIYGLLVFITSIHKFLKLLYIDNIIQYKLYNYLLKT